MIIVTKIFSFAAAHTLPDHKGLCKNLHGHNYKLEVTVGAEYLNENFMIIDFGELKNIINENIIKKYDHAYLNAFFENPTAEVIVREMFSTLDEIFKEKYVNLIKIKLWETDTCFAEYRR